MQGFACYAAAISWDVLFMWSFFKRWMTERATQRLAAAVLALDPAAVRLQLMRGADPNAMLPYRRHDTTLPPSRALGFALRRIDSNHPRAHAVAEILLKNGASLGAAGFPSAASLVISQRNLDLLKIACAHDPLWDSQMVWLEHHRDGLGLVRRTFYKQCQKEGWSEAVFLLDQFRARNLSEKEHFRLSCLTARAKSPSSTRRPQRL